MVLEPYIQCLVIGVGICVGTSRILWQNDIKPILRWGKKSVGLVYILVARWEVKYLIVGTSYRSETKLFF